MTTFFLLVALVLLGLMAVGLWRVFAGPTPADRLLAVQLFGTVGVGVVLSLARVQSDAALIDLALVLALLATVLNFTVVQHASVLLDSSRPTQRKKGKD